MAQSSEDHEQDSQVDRGFPDEMEYDSISDIPPSDMQIVMRIQHVNGSPLPTKMLDKQHLFDFSHQYADEQPFNVKKLAPKNVLYL